MINSSFEDVTAPGSSDPKGFDPIQKLQRPNTKYFSFHRKRQTLENDVHSKQGEPTGNGEVIDKFDKSESKKSGFLRNFKRQLRLKSFSLCKSKQKVKAIENNPTNGSTNAILLSQEATGRERVSSNTSDVTSPKFKNNEIPDREISSLEDNSEKENLERESETNSESPCTLNSLSNNDENSLVKIGNIAEPQSCVSREVVSSSIEDQFSNESRAKANLTEELLKLSKYGWYWGPISGDEADAKLVSEPDGAFLVRDSSDKRYLLTLSFKSSGKLLHARMEHNRGLFSLYNHPETEGFTSVAALINHSMNFSQSAVFCYSRPRYPGYPSFPVRLTKPVSRFTQVRSLQYLCRFVIRQNTRFDNIHKLPLPKTIRGYIEEAHY